MSFPKSPHLVVGDGKQVGVITLWTKKEHVLEHLPKKSFAVCSQLYSRDEGISLLVRSLLENKTIRDLVICGSDLNGCSDALIALWSNGAKDGMINEAAGYVDAEIPVEAIDRLREHVQLHDKREEKDYESLAEYVQKIPQKDTWGHPEVYPQATINPPEIYPSASFHPIRTVKSNDAQRVAAERIKRFGNLTNVAIHVQKQQKTRNPQTTTYLQNFFDDKKGTYGSTIRSQAPNLQQVYQKENQLVIDFPATSVITQLSVREGHVSIKARELTLEEMPMMLEAGFELLSKLNEQGDVTIFADKVECINARLLKELISKPVRARKTGDPASNFLIRLVDGKIQVTHLAPDGKRLEQFYGDDAQQLYLQIIREQRVSDLSHAAYLGYELAKAQEAIKSGGWYEQDAKIRPD